MSKVTNLILITSTMDDSEFTISSLEKFIIHGRPFNIKSIEDLTLPSGWYGGDKHMECNIFIGAYSSFPSNEFIDFISNKVDWYLRENVQVLIKEDADTKFRLIEINKLQ